MRLLTVVLIVALIVLPAKGPHVTDHALISEHDLLPVVHRPVNVCSGECKPLPHMVWFEIRPFLLDACPDSFASQILSDRLDMHPHSFRFLSKPLVVVECL